VKLSDVLNVKHINLNLKASDKVSAIKELIDILYANGRISSKTELYKAIMEREAQATTGIGMGIAIPHCKSLAVKKPSIAFGRSERGVDFQSLDGELAYLFFLIAVPEDAADEHLRLLSQLSRKLVHQEVRQKLMEASSEEEVLKILQK